MSTIPTATSGGRTPRASFEAQADSYKKAHKAREAYMRETSAGIHSAIVDKTVRLV